MINWKEITTPERDKAERGWYLLFGEKVDGHLLNFQPAMARYNPADKTWWVGMEESYEQNYNDYLYYERVDGPGCANCTYRHGTEAHCVLFNKDIRDCDWCSSWKMSDSLQD